MKLQDSPSLVDRMTYTFGGGIGLSLPPTTELGYVSGPGGRAVIYADGHATWKDD